MQNPTCCPKNTYRHSFSHLVREARASHVLDALVQVRISEDNRRVFAPQLQRELLKVGGAALCDEPGGRRGAGEGHQRDVRMADNSIACLWAGAKHNVNNSWRDACTNREVYKSISL